MEDDHSICQPQRSHSAWFMSVLTWEVQKYLSDSVCNNLCKLQLNVISHATNIEKAMWLMARSLPSPTVCSPLNKWIRVGTVRRPSQVYVTNLWFWLLLSNLIHFSWWLHIGPSPLARVYGSVKRGRQRSRATCGCAVWVCFVAKWSMLYNKRWGGEEVTALQVFHIWCRLQLTVL